MKRLLGLLLCGVGLLLPHRLRVLFVEALGWFAQGMAALVTALVRFILVQAGGEAPPSPSTPDASEQEAPSDGSAQPDP